MTPVTGPISTEMLSTTNGVEAGLSNLIAPASKVFVGLAGRIVLSCAAYPNSPECTVEHGGMKHVTEEQKIKLDELHKRKIDLANEILVLNVGGYVGDSTRSEIEYAKLTNKTVRYLEPPK